MTESKYISVRIIEGKPRKVIVDENGKVLNRNPNKGELQGLGKEPRRSRDTQTYTEKELSDILRAFEKKNRRPPVEREFNNGSGYPSREIYRRTFGSWTNGLIKAGLDIDLMGHQGRAYRGRQAEIKVINHFKEHSIDLAGDNQNSSCDGICPNGKIYDVKSSKFHKERGCYIFGTNNKLKDEIEIYYLLAFNEDYTELDYVWRVPGEIVESSIFQVGLSPGFKFDIDAMEKYEITEKFKDIVDNTL